MTKAINNYDKTKISTAHVFLQYNQATMIHKYSLDYNSDWLYITFINRTYRINRKTGSVQWSDNDFEIIVLKKYFWGGNPPHSYIVVLSKIKLLKHSLKKKVLCNFPEWHSISITCN